MARSESGWQEPQWGWIPIGRAVFRFGIADTEAAATSEARADFFSIEAFVESKDREGVSTVRSELDQPTLQYLTELLREHADAGRADIDRDEGRFLFSFTRSSGGAACHGGTPWAILWEPDKSQKPKLSSRLKAPLHNLGHDEAAEGARQSEGVRFATDLVWRRFMLPAFDRAVNAGYVKLFARVPSVRDDFQTLPSDIWPQLEIIDWEHGVARDIQGALYSSIHVADSTVSPIPDTSGGQSFKGRDAVLVEKMRALILRGEANSVSAAAREVLPQAEKLGTDESAEQRLRRAYGRKYPTRTKAKSSET
jgi:hypothetical protein